MNQGGLKAIDSTQASLVNKEVLGIRDFTQASLVNQGQFGFIDKSRADSKHSWLEEFTLTLMWVKTAESMKLPTWLPADLSQSENLSPNNYLLQAYSREELRKPCKFQFVETSNFCLILWLLGSFLLTPRRNISVWRVSQHRKELLGHFWNLMCICKPPAIQCLHLTLASQSEGNGKLRTLSSYCSMLLFMNLSRNINMKREI